MLPPDEFNRLLESHVHPPTWTNPTPAGRYNLVVIGAGTAGLVTAAGAAGLGARVALIERDFMGGDCLNVGCVPSKALISAARVAATFRRADQFGIKVGGEITVDFPAVMERMRRLRAEISPHDGAARFRELGVDVYFGAAKFSGPDSIDVAGQSLTFAAAVIATGARADRPQIPGLAAAGFLTNETVFSLTTLPARLAVLGGGPIGCELAQTFARFGAQVTQIEPASQLLPREDRDAADCVQRALQADGVTVLTDAHVESVTSDGRVKTLTLKVAGESRQVAADEILAATGRVPNVTDLQLDRAGIAFDVRRGVQVNDRLQTTNPRVYAAGDVCSPFKFTHAADFMARIVIQNALFLGRARASVLTIPWCTYTSPEIAHVGISEREARDRGLAVTVLRQPLDQVDRARLEGTTDGFVKVILQAGTDRLLGGTIVAEHAGEMIGELTLAMNTGAGLNAIGSTIHPYPTVAEAIRRTGDQFNRTRLTPFVKRLMARWLAWRR